MILAFLSINSEMISHYALDFVICYKKIISKLSIPIFFGTIY